MSEIDPVVVDPLKRTISASGYETLLKCGERYRRRYLPDQSAGEVRAPDQQTAPMLTGTAFHKVIGYAITSTLAGQVVTVDDCVKVGLKHVVDTIAAGGLLLSGVEYLLDDPAERTDAILHRVERASRWYLENRFESLNPQASELNFEVPIPNTVSEKSPLGWFIIGGIDCLQQDGSVIDFKLSARCPDQDAADKSSQLGIYALARWLETGEVPPSLMLDYVVDSARVHAVPRISTRLVSDCERWLARLQQSIKVIESGMFLPANPAAPGRECSGERCQFYTVCRYGSAKG